MLEYASLPCIPARPSIPTSTELVVPLLYKKDLQSSSPSRSLILFYLDVIAVRICHERPSGASLRGL